MTLLQWPGHLGSSDIILLLLMGPQSARLSVCVSVCCDRPVIITPLMHLTTLYISSGMPSICLMGLQGAASHSSLVHMGFVCVCCFPPARCLPNQFWSQSNSFTASVHPTPFAFTPTLLLTCPVPPVAIVPGLAVGVQYNLLGLCL